MGRRELEIVGRPAVGAKTVVASGNGKLFRLDLKDLTVSTSDLISPDALLGNLVCTDGKLIAANAAGVCVYFSYELAYEQMSERLAKAPDSQKAQIGKRS